jgi:2'-5' RNA ligase
MNRFSVSIWLVPKEDQEKQLREIINDLGSRYNAFPFVPHITAYHLDSVPDLNDLTAKVEKIAQSAKMLSLDFDKIDSSDVFTKTLYAQCKVSQELRVLHSKFKKAFSAYPTYEINPHLSLIYKNNMDNNDKLKEIQAISVPGKILLNRIMIIVREKEIVRERDVLDWRNMGTYALLE